MLNLKNYFLGVYSSIFTDFTPKHYCEDDLEENQTKPEFDLEVWSSNRFCFLYNYTTIQELKGL